MFNISLASEMKSFARESGLFPKCMTYKLCHNANLKNGGTTIQMGILHVLLNILPITLLPRVHDTSGYFEMQKCSHVSLHFEESLKICFQIRTSGVNNTYLTFTMGFIAGRGSPGL